MSQRFHFPQTRNAYAVICLMAAAAAQAQSAVQPAILTSLTLAPSLALVGRTTPVQMHATATFSNGQVTDVSSLVTWSSASGQSVIRASGLLTAVGNGSDTITATYGQIAFGGMAASAAAAAVVDTDRQTVTATIPVGQAPIGAAVNPLTNKIYIANSGSNNVTVIDGFTNNTTTIAAGASPSAIAVNPATNRIYVANKGASVTVIDGAAGTTTTVGTCGGSGPTLAVNPVSNQIFVGCNNGVTVINGANNQTTSISFGTLVTALAVNPATNMVYAATFAQTIEAINGTTQSVIASIPFNFGVQLNLLAVDPARNRIYAGSSQLSFFLVIDGNANQLITPTNPQFAPVGGAIAVNPSTGVLVTAFNRVTTYNPSTNSYAPTKSTPPSASDHWAAAALNPVTGDAYVISTQANLIGILNGANGYLLTSTLSAGLSPVALTINPATNKIYVVNQGSNSVTVVDGASNQITALTANFPSDVQVNPETNQAYIVNNGNNTVSVVDGVTNNITTVSVGANPLAAAVNPVTNKIYVANNGSNNVTVIDGATNTTTTITAGRNPFGMVANPLTDQIYVANSDGTLTIIAGATGTTTSLNEGITAGNGSSAPYGMALDMANNRLYMPNAANGMLAVIDGTAGTVSRLAAGVKPSAVAVNSFTNQIYVADLGGESVIVIDGTTLHETSIPLTFEPWSIGVNRVTGLVYVGGLNVAANLDSFAAIDPNVSPATVLTLAGSSAAVPATTLAVDEVTNKVYFAGPGIPLLGLDGETNTLTFQSDPPLNAGSPGEPNALAINPVTHQVYGVSTILSPAGFFVAEEPVESSPLSVSVASLAGNVTSNPTPSFVLTAVDGLDPGLTANQNVNVYFQFDARDGTWSTAVRNQDGTFEVTPTTPLQPGMQTLLAFATNGREATMSGSGDGFGNGDGPVIGQMLAYVFFVQPVSLLKMLPSLTTDANGDYVVQLSLTNAGNMALANIGLASAVLNSATAPLPAPITSLAVGDTAVMSLTFPASAGSPHTTALLRLAAGYSAPNSNGSTQAGSLSANFRVSLP